MSVKSNKKLSSFILVLVLTVSLFLMVVPTAQAGFIDTWVTSFTATPSTITIDESFLLEVDIDPDHVCNNIYFHYYTPDGGLYYCGYVDSDEYGRASFLYTIPTVIVPPPIGTLEFGVHYAGDFGGGGDFWNPCDGGPISIEVLPGNQPPVADAGGPYLGYEGQAISFYGSGSYDNDGTIICYLWNFGDGETSSDPNPTRMYDQDGIYSVSLTVTDDDSETDVDTTSAIVDDLNPVANFSVSPTSGPAPLTVTFTDSSISYDGVVVWLWDFGDGESSNEQNPTHTYEEGSYNVSLTVWEFDGDSDIETKNNIIIVSPPPPQVAYLVVRGSNNGIYYRIYNSEEETWGNWNALPGSTLDTPAAAFCGDELHVVVRGMDGASLYHGCVDLLTDEFSGWSWVSGSTPSMPRLTSDGDTLYLVVRGNDNRIYHRQYDLVTESWGGWNAVPTGTTVDSPAAAIDGDYLHLVVRGMDDGLYHQIVYLPTLDYLGWSGIGGTTPSAPTLTSNYKNSGDDHILYLTVRGSDNGIYFRSYDGSWNSWIGLPGSTNDAVGACIQPSKPDPDASLHIVVRGMTGGMYHGKYDLNSNSFLGWSWISGEIPSPPTLTS